jgi:hypothetical protein
MADMADVSSQEPAESTVTLDMLEKVWRAACTGSVVPTRSLLRLGTPSASLLAAAAAAQRRGARLLSARGCTRGSAPLVSALRRRRLH